MVNGSECAQTLFFILNRIILQNTNTTTINDELGEIYIELTQ